MATTTNHDDLYHRPLSQEEMARPLWTTGHVARLCGVAPRTVSKWVDGGKLNGYRIPGSQDRRIQREDLLRFLTDNHLPQAKLFEEFKEFHVLVLSTDLNLVFAIDSKRELRRGCYIHWADDAFDAGRLIRRGKPDLAVLDLWGGRAQGLAVASKLQGIWPDLSMLLIVSEDEGDEMEIAKFGSVWRRPFDLHLLCSHIQGMRRVGGG